MKRSVGIGLSAAIIAPVILTAAVSWGAASDTGCWDEYNKRGTRMYRTVTPKGLDLADCTPASSCKWGYAARDGRRNRLYVPHGANPKTACDDLGSAPLQTDPPVTTEHTHPDDDPIVTIAPLTTFPPIVTTPPPDTTAPATTAPATTAPATTAPATTAPATIPPTNEIIPAYQPVPGCADGDVLPYGQSSAAKNHEPLGAIWCYNLIDPPARTAVEGANSWVDDFTVGCPVAAPTGCTSMMSLNDREMGYRVFDGAGQAPGQSQHFINQNHWMVDVKEGFTGGASMRPDRSFKFEDGKIVVEGDFAASIPEYEGDTWGEITITSAAEPTGEIADNLYAYGQFGGHWSVGCRMQASGVPVCAIEGPNANTPPSSGDCSAIPGGYRVAEMSYFQNCGSNTMGGYPSGATPWRQCERDGMDMACRDRFRLEVTKNSLTLYVNGVKYFEDAGWPAAHQLPDSFVNGDVYVYQSTWQVRAGSRAYRTHWDHFAVNPPNGPEPGEKYP